MEDHIKALKVRTVLVDENSRLPTYAHNSDYGNAALDLHSRESYVIMPGEVYKCPVGIRIAIPEGYVGLIWEKSGHAANDLFQKRAGLIDPNYRGEVMVVLKNDTINPVQIDIGMKVAQLIIIENPRIILETVNSLEETIRGASGFGSTGIK